MSNLGCQRLICWFYSTSDICSDTVDLIPIGFVAVNLIPIGFSPVGGGEGYVCAVCALFHKLKYRSLFSVK
jgi:hypothetical protein